MAPIAMGFGLLLSLLGVAIFIAVEGKSWTALIPSFLGVALIILGVIARAEKARKHAMHLAAALALLGTLAGLGMGISALVRDRPATVWGESLGMAVLCGIFLGLCIQSFIAVRRARKQQGSTR